MDANLFIYSIFYSCVGIGFYIFGKRNNLYFRIFGLLLMIFPYFISTFATLTIVGIIFILSPFILNWLAPL